MPTVPNKRKVIYALGDVWGCKMVFCDDGSVWEQQVWSWREVAPIPGTRRDMEIKKPISWTNHGTLEEKE